MPQQLIVDRPTLDFCLSRPHDCLPVFLGIERNGSQPLSYILQKQHRLGCTGSMPARKTSQCGINFNKAVSRADGLLLVHPRKQGEASFMVRVVVNEDGHQNRGVKKVPHFGLPRKVCSRSRRICRTVFSTTSAESGAPVCITQTPCFLYMRPFPRTGRRITRSSELSTSNESPGLNCNSSRTGLGRTIRPALSIVNVVTIMAFYHTKWYSFAANSAFHRRQQVIRQQLLGLLVHPLGVVVRAGDDGHHIQIWKPHHLVPAIARHEVSGMRVLSRLEALQPPQITIESLSVDADMRLRRSFHPIFGHNALPVPDAIIQIQLSEL